MWALWLLLILLVLYGAFVGALVIAEHRTHARALVGFIPDCLVLVRRLMGDPRVPRSRKAMLWGLAAYLAFPLDLVPDIIPVAGQLDDALLVALVLRSVLRSAGPGVLAEHWPGPPTSLAVIQRLAGR